MAARRIGDVQQPLAVCTPPRFMAHRQRVCTAHDAQSYAAQCEHVVEHEHVVDYEHVVEHELSYRVYRNVYR